MSETPYCPCDVTVHPRPLYNPPGRASLSYRSGDYLSFREALLRALPGEVELRNWRPGSSGDLAVQMLEWFAYLADILTFYNERRANEAYLRSAILPESVQGLVRVLGYRPRPGIGARAVVAALLERPGTLVIPQGYPVQSKPGPGQEPQIFEVDQAIQVVSPDRVSADPAPDPRLLIDGSVLLADSISGIKVGEQLLLLSKGWDGSDQDYALARVTAVTADADPRGNLNTRVSLQGNLDALGGALAQDYRLLRSSQSSPPWQYPTGTTRVIDATRVEMAAITRGVRPGDPLLFDTSGAAGPAGAASRDRLQVGASSQTSAGRILRVSRRLQGSAISTAQPPAPRLALVTSYSEQIWYANPDHGDPTQPPAAFPIPIPHTSLGFVSALKSSFDAFRTRIVLRFGWTDVGQLIGTPAATFDGRPQSLAAVKPAAFPANRRGPVLLSGAGGTGIKATGATGGDASSLALTDLAPQTAAPPAAPLAAPMNVYFDLLSVSRGKTVSGEVLGSGDASVAGQEFTLQKSPLTYLLSTTSTASGSVQSTLRVWVNGIEWQEVPSFYGQPPDAHAFVTWEDAEQKTHVQFGDSQFGSRLPSGSGNVVASYRYGSGAAAPAAGQLSAIVQPLPNLRGIANPVPAGGGANPDPPEQIRRYAPRSVLTFGRAVSADDYEAIAATAPGVARARAYWAWDEASQRGLVTVYVGDDAAAVEAARVALRGAEDPNRPVTVKPAAAIAIRAALTLALDPAYLPGPVMAAVRAALIDPDAGLFGSNNVRIGASIHRSQVYAACLAVPGVVAVHSLTVATVGGAIMPGPRYDPGAGRFFRLDAADLQLSQEAA